MPELPEVETVRRGLAPHLEGRRLERVELRRADLRIPFPPDFVQALTGRRVERLDRRAKYLVARLDSGRALIMHLGMSGRFAVQAAGAEGGSCGPHDHVVLETDAGARIIYTDHRRFGLMALADEAERHPLLSRLGLEPLDGALDGPALAAAFGGRRTSVKAALLDQRLVAGIGNIYACEALYRARLSPGRESGTIRGRQATLLAQAIRSVLQEAIAAGGSTLRDHAQANGETGYFQHAFSVYGRAGEPCLRRGCGGVIERMVQAGRSTFHCAKCQR